MMQKHFFSFYTTLQTPQNSNTRGEQRRTQRGAAKCEEESDFNQKTIGYQRKRTPLLLFAAPA